MVQNFQFCWCFILLFPIDDIRRYYRKYKRKKKKNSGTRLIYFYDLTTLFGFKMKPIWIVRNISFFRVNNAIKNILSKKKKITYINYDLNDWFQRQVEEMDVYMFMVLCTLVNIRNTNVIRTRLSHFCFRFAHEHILIQTHVNKYPYVTHCNFIN